MTDQVVSRLGQFNATGDARELFLKLYAGEVLTAFEQKNVFMPLHRTRAITNGKSASFPLVGTANADYHVPGSFITGEKINHGERVVTIDDLLVSAQFISNIDEAMNHYDVRGIYSKEAGNALANAADRNIARIIAKAASITDSTAAAAQFGTAFADEVFTNNVTVAGSAGADIVNAIYDALEEFDKKDITGEKVAVLTPSEYYKLFNASNLDGLAYMNKDVGGSGSLTSGATPVVGGVRILMSNHIPTGDESLDVSVRENYRGDYTGLKGMIFTQDAAATVKLMDLATESEYQIERQGTLAVAKYAMGHNILRPACAIALS